MKKYKPFLIQFSKYNFVGILNTMVDFIVYVVLIQMGVLFIIAQIASYSSGMVNSFMLNKYWTFKYDVDFNLKQVLWFIVVNLASLGISVAMLYVLDQWKINMIISKVLVIGVTMFINFFGIRMLVFNGKR